MGPISGCRPRTSRGGEGGTTQEADNFEGKTLAPALGEGKVWVTQKQVSLYVDSIHFRFQGRESELTKDYPFKDELEQSIWWELMGERRGDPRLVRNNHSLWHTHTHTQHFTYGTEEKKCTCILSPTTCISKNLPKEN